MAFSGGGSEDLMLGVASENAITSSVKPEQMMLRKMRSMVVERPFQFSVPHTAKILTFDTPAAAIRKEPASLRPHMPKAPAPGERWGQVGVYQGGMVRGANHAPSHSFRRRKFSALVLQLGKFRYLAPPSALNETMDERDLGQSEPSEGGIGDLLGIADAILANLDDLRRDDLANRIVAIHEMKRSEGVREGSVQDFDVFRT